MRNLEERAANVVQQISEAEEKIKNLQKKIEFLHAKLRFMGVTASGTANPPEIPAFLRRDSDPPVEQIRPGFLPSGSLTDEEKAKRMERRRQHAAEVNARLKAQP